MKCGRLCLIADCGHYGFLPQVAMNSNHKIMEDWFKKAGMQNDVVTDDGKIGSY